MNDQRIYTIKQSEFTKKSVIYIMSRDQRAQDNHALLEAQKYAQMHNANLYVLFVIKKIGVRSYEHYKFMLDGLRQTTDILDTFNIPFILRLGNPLKEIIDFSNTVDAGALFFDFSPLGNSRNLVKETTKLFNGFVAVVDTHNIIPVWTLSNKQEFAAHTIRRKVYLKLNEYLIDPLKLQYQLKDYPGVSSVSFKQAEKYISGLPMTGIKIKYKPGENFAKIHLNKFIKNNLENYALKRNDISKDYQSGLSPYLHFGNISSLRVVLDVMEYTKDIPLLIQNPKLAEHSNKPSILDGMNTLFEEIIIRKELADNFCFYNNDYKSLNSAPAWAQSSLAEHEIDKREHIYKQSELELAHTHDIIWNTGQLELIKTGKMHGYIRMYWAKKILEWSPSPAIALKTAIYLNDKYSIDGGDPNGYVGILWSIAGLHDRPWFESPVFGKIRYMNEAGLRRKFDVDKYINRISLL